MPITFNVVNSSPVTITGNTVTITGVGSVTVRASQSGNATYNSALSIDRVFTVAAKSITGSFTADNKVYDGNTSATVLTRNLSGVVGSDAVTLSGGTASFATAAAAAGKTVTLTGASLAGADAGNYSLGSVATTTADITAKSITGSFTADNKVYDGNTSATVLSRNLSGVVGSDAVTLSGGTASFATAAAAAGKTVTLTGASLAGADAANYSLGSVATTTADITAKSITGSFTADNKVYDGNTSATVLSRNLSGVVGSDAVTLSGGTASFATAAAAAGKTVTLTGASLAGADAGNYSLGSVATTTADITAKSITGSFTADNKVYDGNTSATVLTRNLSGVVGSDAVTLSGGTASFATAAAAAGKTVTLTGASLAGADAANYTLSSVATTTADITAKSITGSFTADNKVYDGNTSATVLTRNLSGVVGSDAVTLSGGTASFATAAAGTGKTVTLSGASLAGGDAGNYSLGSVATTTADITAKSITIIADAKSKVYGEADPALTAATPAGVITGDMATGALTRAPGSSVGTYAISKGTYTYGANYTESFTGADLTITKKTIAVAAVAKTKVYGENDPTLTYTFSPALVSGDAFSGALTRASGNDVGTYAIQQGTLALSSNYTLNFTGANLTITKKTVTVTAEAKTKVYGTADPMLTYTYSPALVGNDSFSGALTRVAGEDVANSPYAIQQGTLALSSNYTLNYVGANLTITPQTANPLANTYYTGSTFFWTPSTTSSNAVLTLAATIKNSPNYGGDIRTAKVSFFIRNGQTVTPISGAQNLPVGLVNPNDLSVGSAATTVQYNLGSADYATLEIGISVSGNYTANPSQEFDKIITVAKPIPGGLIVGNAVLDDAGSSGYVSGSVTVGFGVQYNKSLKNPQGSVDMLVTSFRKSDGSPDITKHVYRIKSNAISVLSVGKPSSSDAQFTSKANISEVVNGVDQAIEGNCTMQFNMKQGPNDGPAGDEVAITIYRAKGGIWYSNNWNGTQTVLKQIETGNVSVSGGSAGTPRMGVEESSEPMLQLTVEASPNPTKGLLNVSVKGAGDQPSVKIRLYNLLQGVSGEWALDLQDGQGQKTIDIQSVNEGMYFLSVEGTNGRAVQRVLKGN